MSSIGQKRIYKKEKKISEFTVEIKVIYFKLITICTIYSIILYQLPYKKLTLCHLPSFVIRLSMHRSSSNIELYVKDWQNLNTLYQTFIIQNNNCFDNF